MLPFCLSHTESLWLTLTHSAVHYSSPLGITNPHYSPYQSLTNHPSNHAYYAAYQFLTHAPMIHMHYVIAYAHLASIYLSHAFPPSLLGPMHGHLKHGFYVQNELTLHPDMLAHYYGSGSTSQSRQSQTEINSNGQNSDEEWEDVEDIEAGSVPYTKLPSLIAEEQASQFLHKVAKVPKHINPFDHEDLENVFKQALDEVKKLNHMPFELGVREEEWGNEGYPEIEIIPSSHQRNKELVVELPHFVCLAVLPHHHHPFHPWHHFLEVPTVSTPHFFQFVRMNRSQRPLPSAMVSLNSQCR